VGYFALIECSELVSYATCDLRAGVVESGDIMRSRRGGATGIGSRSAFDPAGRRVAIILAESRAAGDHSVGWDGLDAAGRPLPSGTYLLRLRAGGLEVQTKAVLVR